MYITPSTQTQYAQAINKSANIASTNENKNQEISTVKELLGEDGYEFFNELISGLSEEDANAIELVLDFQLSIKSESVVNDKLSIERETDKLDAQTIESKLDLLIAKRKDDIEVPLADKMDAIVDKLKEYYSNKNETNSNIIDKEDSVIDDFMQELYSKESINLKSSLIKDEITNKVDEYTSLMMEDSSSESISKVDTEKLINQFKHELLAEYKDSLSANENSTKAEQQAIIKVLLDESVKETSSLEKLLAGTFKTK